MDCNVNVEGIAFFWGETGMMLTWALLSIEKRILVFWSSAYKGRLVSGLLVET